jgi:hypothetical protein
MRDNDVEIEGNQCTIYVYMDMSQLNPPFNYHILTKTFLKVKEDFERTQQTVSYFQSCINE